MKNLEKLLKKFREISYLNSALSLLQWDQRTYLPSDSGKDRSEVIGYLSSEFQKKVISKDTEDLLANIQQEILDMHEKRIYNPIIINASVTNNVKIDSNFKVKNPYIFSNNLSYIHKNLKVLLKAFNYILDKTNVNLVISGNLYADDETEKLMESLKKKNRLFTPGYLEEEEFYYILKNSSLFINPSSFEGFGMSAVEAMISSVPCLLSNNTATYEVTKGLADYYSPAENHEILAENILESLNRKHDENNLEKISQNLKETYNLKKITVEYLTFLIL